MSIIRFPPRGGAPPPHGRGLRERQVGDGPTRNLDALSVRLEGLVADALACAHAAAGTRWEEDFLGLARMARAARECALRARET